LPKLQRPVTKSDTEFLTLDPSAPMTPHEFRHKWRNVELKERTASQSHFNDLCALLEIADPITADPKGEFFTFEKGAKKTGGGDGWADVWRKGCFAWEYKGKHKDLAKAHGQLLQYASALENPPLLIVSDMDRILIHTNWTNSVSKTYEITIEDILDADKRLILKNAFLNPDELKPTLTRQKITEEAAQNFAALAQRLRDRGNNAPDVAHFLNKLVFCLFAEDAELLPDKLFQKLLNICRYQPQNFADHARTLFTAMRDKGGKVGFDTIEWFNGGLFADDIALELDKEDVAMLIAAAKLDWSEIDPSIMGTLFERGLDPAKRSQLGAHYTDRDKIMMILEPVIIRPLESEWAMVRETIADLMGQVEKADQAIKAIQSEGAALLVADPEKSKATEAARRSKIAKVKKDQDTAFDAAKEAKAAFLERLKAFRVLDPACGSGNFLNLSLLALKDIEHKVNVEAEQLGLVRAAPATGPENMLGIELNDYAAELARVSVWIAEIQWMRKNGFEANRNPILRTLDNIECRDAVLASDGTRAAWPKADVVVGNPPFLGSSKFLREMGDDYSRDLRKAWEGVVPGAADLVCYWFANAWTQIQLGNCTRAGLVATNSIRGGANRSVLTPITEDGAIFEAWSDEAWTVDGAAVRVSLICFSDKGIFQNRLNGRPSNYILADLSSNDMGFDLTTAVRLAENSDVGCYGSQQKGSFSIDAKQARLMLQSPNPHNLPNSLVVKKSVNARQIAQRKNDSWLVDFGLNISEAEAALFEQPFTTVRQQVYPERTARRDKAQATRWWLHARPSVVYRKAIEVFDRCIVTPAVAKHRTYSWLSNRELADHALVVFARDDDTTFGILHSRFHELWSLRMGTFLGVGNDPRYTPSTTFETFPFPGGLTPNIPAPDYAADPRAIKIAAAAARLNELRENWLNPADLVVREPEVVAGYPDRILPRDEDAAKTLKTRTLTNLYNTRPAWLDNAHKVLDEAVAEAYGWGDDYRAGLLTDDEILSRLFALNQERAGK
jgi:type II restriction/modification system DNA methylase subunit YeeA